MTDLGTVAIWICSFPAIWFIFLKTDDAGANYFFVGNLLLLADCVAGAFIIDSPVTFIVMIAGLIYFGKNIWTFAKWDN